ncbi:phosphatidate cytidylyltransferase [Sphingomonas sp. Leaf343]|uniref:phosphatidate cytidylyltransferase n=1 Tax=Sphingomonas sp. Leaf343 TaxID=1736345 RepID=UPI0006FF4E9F|nr:phosphatidate cytidylyltransferase [Sphingomonas sp. Leaf343]KQR84271.1 phosphatidate cytidylyltransferase [Sphingomonas sp. Leaf343]
MIASVAMIAVAMVALLLGGIGMWLLAVVVCLFMMAEWADLAKVDRRTKRMSQFALSVPLALMSPLAAGPHFFVLGVLGAAFFFVAIVTRNARLAAGTLYCGLPVFALLVIREQSGTGLVHALWALSLVWATDIGAFFAGRSIGGPKLAPKISPAKTWSGLIGGILLATLVAYIIHAGYGLPSMLVLATPVLAVLAQAGDLFESALKRRAGVKDSGNTLPGHGGVLDRLDGVVPVMPVAMLLVILPTLLA